MASSERVHKLSAEAFSRLRNDHEQFLEAYEKPTQIYRFLRARHSLKSLFMHRNLSYMQHRNSRRRKKRTRRVRVNDLLKYRRERELEGVDLASQINSDNFLKITFHDLEKGIDFSHLLSAAIAGDVEKTPPTCHAPSLMEVEVLLCSCHQHASEAASCPCSSASLGKFEVEYRPTENAKIVGPSNSSSSSNGSAGGSGSKHTLTIPESKLVWRGRSRATGSLMLVFRARASKGQTSSLSSPKKSVHHTLAKVSVELNRINHSDIAQLTKTKLMPTQTASNSASLAKIPRTMPQSASDFGSQRAAAFSELSNGPSSFTAAMESHGSFDAVTEAQSAVDVPSKMSRKMKSKGIERRDACIMTDLSLGTGAAHSPVSDHQACNSPSEHGIVALRNNRSSATPPLPKKGFTENCTSLLGKLAAQRNGLSTLNGLCIPNGFGDDHHSKTTEHYQQHHDQDDDAAFLDSSSEADCSLTVSIPCTYHNGSHSSSTDGFCMDSSTHNHVRRRYSKIPTRKRSEIQLLLDGDKPPGQRISAEEIPVFTAEDPSNRSTRSHLGSPQSKGSWTQLGTGTRKITPVEPFTYPVSPTLTPKKVAGIKRSFSESDTLLDPTAPLPKLARLSERDQAAESMEEDKEEKEGEVVLMKEEGGEKKSAKEENDIEMIAACSEPTSPLPNSDQQQQQQQTGEKSGNSPVQAPGGAAPGGVFCAEMVVFDSRGECLLDEGEYSILMQKCPQKEGGEGGSSAGSGAGSPLVTFAPLVWSSVFGGEVKSEVEQSESMMLKFSLSWSQGPPKHRLITEMETALDLQRIRNDYFPATPRHSTTASSPNNIASSTIATALSFPVQHSESSNPLTDPPPTTALDNLSNLLPAGEGPGSGYVCNGRGTVEEEGREAALDTGGETMLENSALDPRKKFLPPKEERRAPDQDRVELNKDDIEDYSTATSVASATDSTELAQYQAIPSPENLPPTLLPCSSSVPLRTKTDQIIYNFLYHNNSLQQTESRGDMRCPWCSLLCRHLYSLLKHMSLCHPRFLFTYTPTEGGSIIDVHVNKLYEAGQTSMDRDPVERSGMSLKQRWKGPLKCLPCTAVIVERQERVEEDLSEFLNDGSWKRGYNVNRQYYHSHTCLPLVPEEIDIDSETELETAGIWQKTCSQKMIDEFTDVNRGEKEMMKLWNLFAMEQGMTAYKQIPAACLKFTQEKGPEIIEKNIVYSFLAHLMSLCDFGLITPSVIKSCMDLVVGSRPS